MDEQAKRVHTNSLAFQKELEEKRLQAKRIQDAGRGDITHGIGDEDLNRDAPSIGKGSSSPSLLNMPKVWRDRIGEMVSTSAAQNIRGGVEGDDRIATAQTSETIAVELNIAGIQSTGVFPNNNATMEVINTLRDAGAVQ